MICNSAECVRNDRSPWYCPRTGRSSKKKYVNNKLSLPKGEVIQAHVVEVLQQAERSQVARGGWISGDAWFGSVNSCVELMKKKGIYSTFIVKQNLNYGLTRVLYSVLLARYKTRPAGHWVVMKSVISGIDIFILVYAYSNKHDAYFCFNLWDNSATQYRLQILLQRWIW